MRWFFNLKITYKLLIGFMTVAVIAAIIGIGGIINIKKITNASTQLYEDNLVGLKYAGEAVIEFQEVRANTFKLILTTDENERAKYVKKINEHITATDNQLKSYEAEISNEEDRKLYSRVKNLWESFKSLLKDITNLVEAGNNEEAQELMFEKSDTVIDTLNDMFSKLFEYNTSAAEEKANNNNRASIVANTIMSIIVLIGVLIAIFLGIFISRIISKPIKKLEEAAEQLAVGDINVKIETKSKDEIGKLMRAFSKMVDNIREQAYVVEMLAAGDMTVGVKIKSENDLMGKKLKEMIKINNESLWIINNAADEVASGARQVSDSSQTLAYGSTEQASSIEEVTASMTQIADQTKKNAQNAGLASEIVQNAKEKAIVGNNQMQEMIKAMEDINNSSVIISKIIKVIDEIAFQTNILALNAAIEAARAGQYGKGFAVVANEVRNLAARSASAAKETTELIENSVKKIVVGNKIANSTGEALNEIVENVTKATELVGEIATASNEQASGIAQINQAITQVAYVVQTNSATAEQSAAASEELSAQAELLKGSVSKFKLKKVEDKYELKEKDNESIEEDEEVIETEDTNQFIEQETENNNEELALLESALSIDDDSVNDL